METNTLTHEPTWYTIRLRIPFKKAMALKEGAKKDYRSIGGQLEALIDNYLSHEEGTHGHRNGHTE